MSLSIPNFYTEIALDVACEDPSIIVPTKQLDNLTRILRVYMYDSVTGEDVTIQNLQGISATLNITRPDGVLIQLPVDEIHNEYISVSLTEDCLAVSGKALADIKLYKGEEVFSAASFALDIQRTATGTQSETRGILTRANLQIISRADYNSIQKEANTLYVVIDGDKAALYIGEIPISSGGASIGYMTALATGISNNITGTPTESIN